MNTWLNPNKDLHPDLLKQQIVIGELLHKRFVAEERIVEAYEITLELDKIFILLTSPTR
jgi:hypothetical protein